MWKNIYDSFFQVIAGPWSAYLSSCGAQGRLVRDAFFNTIYPYSGIILMIVCLFATLLYYFHFNSKFGRYYKLRSWFLWMLASALIIGISTFILTSNILSSFMCQTTLLIICQSFINLIYGFILFFIFSIICQVLAIVIRRLFFFDISPMGSRTPF